MLAVTLLVASIAVADSINPSTVVPALYLATRPRAVGLASFTVGVFAAYLAGGLVLVLGPGPALIAALRDVGPQVQHVTELCAGAVLLGAGVVAWRSRGKPDGDRSRSARGHSRGSAFALGAGIATIELPTAFMYFGAVSAILGSGSSGLVQVALVVAYNVLFVLPLVAILGLRLLAGERAERRLVDARARLRRAAPVALAAVAGCAGAVLASVGLGGLVVLG
jgi:threonine/homoserine/homoserine lactone efflux protein